MLKEYSLIIFSMAFLGLAGCNSSSNNPAPPLSSPFSERLSVDTDNQGNFMAAWQDGASIYSADYTQGVRQTPFRVAFGDNPDLAMSNDGNLIYISWNNENTIPGNTKQRAFTRVYDRTNNTWSEEIKEPIFLPYLSGLDSINPQIAVYDDLLVLVNTINYSTLDFYERITTSLGTSTYPFFNDMDGYTGGGATGGWYDAETGITKATPVVGIKLPAPLTVYASQVDIASNHQGMMVWSQQTHGLTAPSGFSEQSGLFAKYFSGQKSRLRFHERQYAHDGTFVLLTKQDIKEGNYKLAMQANGDAVIAWTEEHPGIASAHPHHFYLRTANFTASSNQWVLSNQWTFNSLNFSDLLFENAKFDVDMDDQGNAIILWDNPTSGLNRVTFDGAAQSWNTAEIVDTVGNYSAISVDTSPNGNSIASWSKGGNIFISEYTAATQIWSSAKQTGEGDEVEVAIDDNGDCLVAWKSNGEIFDYQCGKVPLNISVSTGGRVISQPAGIICGTFNGNSNADCSASFDNNSTVTLKLSVETGFTFSAWTGDCTGSSINDIAVTMDAAKNCTATFTRDAPTQNTNATLTVNITGGPDAGVVKDSVSSSPNMYCLNTNEITTTCSAVYTAGSVVDLFSSAFPPNNEVSWNNCDSISEGGVCRITLTQDETVSASFSVQPTGTTYSISVSDSTNGGNITSVVPAGITGSIDCPSVNCADLFIVDVSGSITILATPKPGATFMQWGANQCDSESRSNGVGICTMDLINGSPPTTTRRADAFFLVR